VLIDLGLDEPTEKGMVEAMNKIDLLDPAARASLGGQWLRNSQSVSAATGEGCDALLELIDRRLESEARVMRLEIPLTDGKMLAWVYDRGEVLGRRDDNEAAHLSVRLSEADIARLRHRQRLH
jgi:GTP-binding protein HflX